MKTLGYYNGKTGEADEIMIPFGDRSHWFGDGVYDAGPSRNYKLFAIDEHIERFFNSAALMDIIIPKSKEEIKDLLYELVKKMDSGDNFVYIQCTRGGLGIRNHLYEKELGNLWVMMTPQKVNEGIEPIKLITAVDTRFFHCNCKTLNLLPSVQAAEEAKIKGCAEAILYRPNGRVTECAHSNCHIIKDGKLYTAPTDELILPGIARAHMIRMAKKLGYGVSETPYNIKEVFDAEEVLVTSSSNPCLHANEVDGKTVGGKNHDMLENLRSHLVEELYDATE